MRPFVLFNEHCTYSTDISLLDDTYDSTELGVKSFIIPVL